MENIKISIIMPVYNVEKYVSKAIESIQKQTLKDWEFIIVDDGTPDKSGEICDKYAECDERIQVIHKKNGGAPSARNTAIDLAKGKYIYFMDSDDWAEPTMLEDMYNLAETNHAQLIISGYYIDTYYNNDEYITTELFVRDQIFNTKQDFRKNAYKLFDKNLLYTPWNKLYSSKYIKENNLKFPNTFWDDFPFNLSVIRDIEKVAVTSKKYYHFMRARAESETAKYRSDMYEKREEEHQWMIDLYKYWGINDKDSLEMLNRRYIERLIGCIENVTSKACSLSSKEKKAEIKKMICTPEARKALKVALPNSLMMKILLLPLKWKSVMLTYLECKYISRVKTSNVKRFAILKSNR